MCGRYRLSKRKQLIEEYFDTVNEVDWEPRYNIAPSQNVGIIRQDATRQRRAFFQVRWGLIPSWAKDASVGHKMINARSETVAEKPAFRDPFRTQRCLIPANGFYEWSRHKKTKQPFHFGMRDDSLFAFAGIWDRWNDAQGGFVETCSILTTTPNSLLLDVHDRMPVILEPTDYELWLDPAFRNLSAVSEMLKPFNPDLMKRHPVTSRVNAPTNDDPECSAEAPLKSAFEGPEQLLLDTYC